MGYKELIDEEFKVIVNEYNLKTKTIMAIYENDIEKVKQEYDKKYQLLEKGYNETKFTDEEYSHGKVLLDKKIKEEIGILRKNMESEIEDAKRVMASSRNVVIRDVCKSIEEKLKQKYTVQYEELQNELGDCKTKITNVESELEQYSISHNNELKELEEKQKNEIQNSISKMKDFQTNKLKMECVYIPEEKKQQFKEYIDMGVIPVKLIDSLELLTAKESVEKKVLEDIEIKYNNEKIELEKKLKEKNITKLEEKELLKKELVEIEQKIKQLEEKRDKELSEISDMKQKYEDGPELV